MWLNKIRNPLLFQGNMKDKNYFEGWYYKQVSVDEKKVISFIPGVSLAMNDAHSFVQYIYVSFDENDNKTIKTGYIRYLLEDFMFNNNPFLIRVANNIFTESGISINMTDHELNIEGTLNLDSFTPIRESILMPNIMGFFAYLPKMECYHGIISMNHMLHGALRINETEIDFNGGKGYIEKDWGTSFPQKYIWIQCNNFKNKNTSVICSAADIPFMNKSFLGHISNLVVDKKEYRFATYNHSKLNIECITDEKIVVLLESRNAKLRVEANLKKTGELIAPKQGKMEKIIKEGLSGEVKIYLYNKQNEIIYEDYGNMAGIEIVGF